MATNLRTSSFTFAGSQRERIDPYLPSSSDSAFSSSASSSASLLPFLTLTYASSLDSTLSLTPGSYHAISSPQSMALTHYLRARFSAILIGVGTAVADNPGLNCRLEDHPYGADHQPRPVVVDPRARWSLDEEDCQFLRLAREGKGKAPWIVTSLAEDHLPLGNKDVLEKYGGKYITLRPEPDGKLDWRLIMQTLRQEGLASVLIDGGGRVINQWLSPECQAMLESVVVTVAPAWLGSGGVVVCPERRVDDEGHAQVAARVRDVRWVVMGEDVVLLGRFDRFAPRSQG